MCTRFYIEPSPEIQSYIDLAAVSPLTGKMAETLGRSLKVSGDVRPTDMAAVIAPSRSGKRTVFPMIWGYSIQGIASPVVNARIETAKNKRSFSADWQKHRCVIPASYYFEWQHFNRPDGTCRKGSKYAIRPRGVSITFLAGLYRIEEKESLKYPVFTVLTKTPSAELAKIHNRMPVILPEKEIDNWIDLQADPEEVAETALMDMIIEKAG